MIQVGDLIGEPVPAKRGRPMALPPEEIVNDLGDGMTTAEVIEHYSERVKSACVYRKLEALHKAKQIYIDRWLKQRKGTPYAPVWMAGDLEDCPHPGKYQRRKT